MPRIVVSIFLLGFLAACTETPSEPSTPFALANGGFEAGDDAPDPWFSGATDPAGFIASWQDGSAYQGTRFARISRTQGTTTHYAFWAQTIRADEFVGGPVTLRARIRTELAGDGVALVIRGDDTETPSGESDAFVTTNGTLSITGSSAWQEWSVTLDELPTGIVSITVFLIFLPQTTGVADFDQVELEATDS